MSATPAVAEARAAGALPVPPGTETPVPGSDARAAGRPSPPGVLRARDVAELTVMQGFPCISLLMPTEPAPRMTAPDASRLRTLVAQVADELNDQGVLARDRLLAELRLLAVRVAGQPTDRALAVYVSQATTRAFRLPHPVTPRAVVEQTFATRDLVQALHRLPPHVVLVMHPWCAHLYQAGNGRMHPVSHRDLMPTTVTITIPGVDEPDPAMSAAELEGDLVDGFLRRVDRMLGDYRSEHPSPLVLSGDPAVLDRFTGVSTQLHRLAGRVAVENGSVVTLAREAALAVESYLRGRAEDAFALLADTLARRPSDVAVGVAECWRAVHDRAPLMLLVEEGYVSPGAPPRRHSPDGSGPRSGSEAGRPVHDLVDDLMETVILRGGQLAIVEADRLVAHGRVALVSQARSTR